MSPVPMAAALKGTEDPKLLWKDDVERKEPLPLRRGLKPRPLAALPRVRKGEGVLAEAIWSQAEPLLVALPWPPLGFPETPAPAP